MYAYSSGDGEQDAAAGESPAVWIAIGFRPASRAAWREPAARDEHRTIGAVLTDATPVSLADSG